MSDPPSPTNLELLWKSFVLNIFSRESDPLPKCCPVLKIVNSDNIFDGEELEFPHYIGSLTWRQKQIIDKTSCVSGVVG